MGETGTGKSLAGKGIVVTRPVHQAAHLAGLIRAESGNPLLFPVIEIVGLDDTRPLLALIDRLDEFDWAVFVSPNAVMKALSLIHARRTLPARVRFAAVGRGSVRELKLCGVTAVIAPARFDSEALLELPPMQDVTGKRIVIFRGEGGRDFLGDTLTARGAAVEYAACYRRGRPRIDGRRRLRWPWRRETRDHCAAKNPPANARRRAKPGPAARPLRAQAPGPPPAPWPSGCRRPGRRAGPC